MQFLKNFWLRLLSWPRRYTIGGVMVILVLVLVAVRLHMHTTSATTTPNTTPTVSVSSVGSLSSQAGPLSLVGKVTSLSQATILAQTSGQLVRLSVSLGDHVSAGQVLGSFENSSQEAAVLQAQGQYDGALAAQTAVSPVDAHSAAINAYTSAYSTLDTLLTSDVDTFFGAETATGPQLLMAVPSDTRDELSRERDQLSNEMSSYQTALANANSGDPARLLSSSQTLASQVSNFLVILAAAANQPDSNATAAQLTALATARAGVASLISTLTTASQTYRSQSVSTTASTNASITTALGGLRAAQANLEKTIARATISGTIVSLPVNRGDFVNTGSTVAIISNPGALEVDTYVTSDDAQTITVGDKAVVNGTQSGVVVFVAPAIDPTTGQIEVKIGLPDGTKGLTDGDTVTVSLARAEAKTAPAFSSAIMIPINAAKITPQGPIVFTVASSTSDTSTLIANPVTFGSILGDQVTVTSGLTPDMQIVTDARGLSEGETVTVASSTQ